MRRAARLSAILLLALPIVALLAVVATKGRHVRETDPVSDEQKIARTLGILRTSTPANRKVLKVLFYGQSITLSGWHKEVVHHWTETYPNTTFVVQNLALGGFSSEQLEHTTERDIESFYPDLIVFHVYGDHRAYERILRIIRSRTTADVILQTDFGNTLPDPSCDEGFHLALHHPSGCAGWLWWHQRNWYDEMSYHKIPAFAKKYGLAVEAQRGWWRDYLLANHTDPRTLLLPDGIHPNDAGKALIAAFFDRYFDSLVAHWDGQTESDVVSIAPAALQPQSSIPFRGNRLELLTSQPIAAWPEVTVDGQSVHRIDGCYQVTRSTPTPTAPEWPAVRRISLNADHAAEDWTATVTSISPDQKRFQFTVAGSISGDQGAGDSFHKFVSRSGTLSIEPDDWMLGRAFALTGVPAHAPFNIGWSVQYVCGGGNPESAELGEGSTQFRYILVTGLANAAHTARFSLPVADMAKVLEFRAYAPPLQ